MPYYVHSVSLLRILIWDQYDTIHIDGYRAILQTPTSVYVSVKG